MRSVYIEKMQIATKFIRYEDLSTKEMLPPVQTDRYIMRITCAEVMSYSNCTYIMFLWSTAVIISTDINSDVCIKT